MAKYVLTRGKFTLPSKDGGERTNVKVGEAVELTNSQAEAFSDFFKPLEVYEAEIKVIQAAAKKASGEPAEKPSAAADKK